MTSSASNVIVPCAVRVAIENDALRVELTDGREIAVPLEWYPRLLNGRFVERMDWRLIDEGRGIHWPQLDEDIEFSGLLAGRRSSESPTSLARWLAGRSV